MIVTLLIASIFAATPDWLTCKGTKIVDMNGNEVLMSGLNWFGYNTGSNIFDGIWSANLYNALQGIANRGFNTMRVPISVQLLTQWMDGKADTRTPNVNTAENPELMQNGRVMDSFTIWNKVVGWCGQMGIKIFIDIHSAPSDTMGHMLPLWYTGQWTAEQFYASLEWFADYYKNDDTIVGIDVKNEPHGKPTENEMAIWDNSTAINNFKLAAETAGRRCLAKNPHLLIFVEGIETFPKDGKTWTSKNMDDYHTCWWGGNIRGAKDYPIDLGAHQAQLVYSPHDYGPSVFAQTWFNKNFTIDTLYEDCWRDNWHFIYESGMTPLMVGEWGGFLDGGNGQKWMTMLRDFIVKNKHHQTFWCYNANSGDTGGLVKDDFRTWDEAKYTFVKPLLWQSGGKFVSLSHKAKMGASGLSLADLYGIA